MSVKQLVDDAIAQNKLVIFSRSSCGYCKYLKDFFALNYPKVDPIIFELDERDDGSAIQDYLVKLTGQRTVPNIFIKRQHMGGCDDVVSLHHKGGLAQLLYE